MLNSEEAVEVLSQFPEVSFAFAYGSGAVAQNGYDYKQKLASDLPMLDLILVVDNPYSWHAENMERNPHHYSPLVPLKAEGVSYVQQRFQAHFWFNPYVPAAITTQPGRMMKYGVISTSQALEDLQSWNNLYLAGRLHKPVHILKNSDVFEQAMHTNRLAALQTTFLLLPPRFSEVDLFLTVASLSYVGDPRMLVGENPKKVENLVLPVVPLYQELYSRELETLMLQERVSNPITASAEDLKTTTTTERKMFNFGERFASLRKRMRPAASSPTSTNAITAPSSVDRDIPLLYHHVPHHPYHSSNGNITTPSKYQGFFVQDGSPAARWQRSLQLPPTLKTLLRIRTRNPWPVPIPHIHPSTIRTALASIVASAATAQTVKGLFTAGLRKSTVYAWNKVSKRFGFASLPFDAAK